VRAFETVSRGLAFALLHSTQEEPQYCGLAALSMSLNALGIDPRRTWKVRPAAGPADLYGAPRQPLSPPAAAQGAWRWFSEGLLDCCKSAEDVKRDGITMGEVRLRWQTVRLTASRAGLVHSSVQREGDACPAAVMRTRQPQQPRAQVSAQRAAA
jgi:hypothetical protein